MSGSGVNVASLSSDNEILPKGFESGPTIPRKSFQPFFEIDSMSPSFCRYGG